MSMWTSTRRLPPRVSQWRGCASTSSRSVLRYAESADRYPEIRAACLEGFHDMSRMLELAGIPLNPMEL